MKLWVAEIHGDLLEKRRTSPKTEKKTGEAQNDQSETQIKGVLADIGINGKLMNRSTTSNKNQVLNQSDLSRIDQRSQEP